MPGASRFYFSNSTAMHPRMPQPMPANISFLFQTACGAQSGTGPFSLPPQQTLYLPNSLKMAASPYAAWAKLPKDVEVKRHTVSKQQYDYSFSNGILFSDGLVRLLERPTCRVHDNATADRKSALKSDRAISCQAAHTAPPPLSV